MERWRGHLKSPKESPADTSWGASELATWDRAIDKSSGLNRVSPVSNRADWGEGSVEANPETRSGFALAAVWLLKGIFLQR